MGSGLQASSCIRTRLLPLDTPRLYAFAAMLAISLVQAEPSNAQGFGCAAPSSPFVPNDTRDVQACADLICGDLEAYVADFEVYERCLNVERTWAFEEGESVARESGRFQQLTERLGSRDPES